MTPQTPREQENELQITKKMLAITNRWVEHGQYTKCFTNSLCGQCSSLLALIKQDREAYATQVKKKAELALVVDLEAKTADGEWLSMWIKNQYKRLDAHAQQETIGKCEDCDGRGYITVYADGSKDALPEQEPCDECNGTGQQESIYKKNADDFRRER